MVTPLIKDVLTANQTLKRAITNKCMNGLHFNRLQTPLRVTAINDSSHVPGTSLYAQVAKMVMLMSDSYDVRSAPEWIGPEEATKLEGFGHPLYSTGRKATRVSHSTSHGESLAMLNGTQVAQLIAN